ncbi:transporter substrate-binding domain-containing protein [Pseudomonas tolaasii]|uniref:transporter substrate-binding domain-containing protein n=1 Tax=Pseudomonas tolaasii TaxID=29442 RepID=UPI001C591687|nr:transporter substrate-binding domain-containing protein [Pseudomonas tolaasii]MBW1250626.1 transporter substrate-binding domain-containing protein [Pseudomonas tolaasii]
MKTFARLGLLFVCLAGLLCSVIAMAEPQPLQLLGRSSGEHHRLKLSEADWAWLRQKRTLILGIAQPDYVPYQITSTDTDFEGITADFARLLSEALHVQISVKRYDSRAAETQALAAGEIDLISSSGMFDAGLSGLTQSRAYAQNQAVLVTRNEEKVSLPQDLSGKTIAMFEQYLPAETVQAFYPAARLQLYPSDLAALGAVAFGHADVYLGNSTSANYLINKNALNNVQLSEFSGIGVNQFSFVMAADNSSLVRLVNSALESVSDNEQAVILRRWSAGDRRIQGDQKLKFTPEERHWIGRHPVVSVLVNDDLPPLSFFDDNDVYRGVTANVLARITQLTGLKFDVKRGRPSLSLLDDVGGGRADMLAAFVPNFERATELRVTRPYLTTPMVLVTPGGANDISSLADLGGKKLAIIHSNRLKRFIADGYPTVQLSSTDTGTEALDMVVSGQADAAAVLLINALYRLSREGAGRLSIGSTLDMAPVRLAFATQRGALELYSILDKALLSIPPDEMDDLTNRWRNEVVVSESFWLKYRIVIFEGVGLLIALMALATWWIARLRRLVNRLKAAEKALSNQVEFKRALVNGIPHPLYVRDREGRMISCNSSYLEFFKFTRDDVIGKRIIDMENVDPVVGRAYHDECMAVMASGEPLVRDRRLVTMFGDEIAIFHWLLPYHDTDGNVVGVISGWLDISEREHLLKEAQLAKDAAEEANRAKTTFFATLSHEIRTPMNAMTGGFCIKC